MYLSGYRVSHRCGFLASHSHPARSFRVPPAAAPGGLIAEVRTLIVVSSLSIELGGRTVVSGLSFTANPGEIIGVAGPNGAGKTTLLRAIRGELRPSSGSIDIATGLRLGYLAQGSDDAAALPAGDAYAAAFPGDATSARLESIAAALASAKEPDAIARLSRAYDEALDLLENRDSDELERVRGELGIAAFDPQRPLSGFSGGERTRIALTALAAGSPDALLLDEPTNHLDLPGIRRVEQLIRSVPGPVIVVSHDRALLDAVCTSILALEPGKPGEMFAGGYRAYASELARHREQEWEAYRRQQREERQLRQNIAAAESRSRHIENSTIDFAIRKKAAKIARRSVTLKARLERQIESAEHLDRPGRTATGFQGSFAEGERGAGRLILADNLRLEAGGRTLADGLTFQLGRGQRLAVTGPNGSGKTTLIRAILGDAAPAGGVLEVAASARPGYLPQEDMAILTPGEANLTPLEFLRRTSRQSEAEINNFLHRFLFARGEIRTPVGLLSYGERRRLALARLVLGGANLLLLDEPTNHLDIPSREAFETALDGFEGGVLVVTHDRYLLERLGGERLELGGSRGG
ncbi:MAG: ATP-binding cassette domain-containing protein [Dehalococcoidia bacterium]|nr:ATP-binding cassette domain-containing protein [Dehalococcoidia bacterium]